MKTWNTLKWLALLSLLSLICVRFSFPRVLAEAQSRFPTEPVFLEPKLKPLAQNSHSMVSSAHPFATFAGQEMLRRGGNAMDAAVAAMLVTGVVDTGLTSLAGGGVLTYYDAKTKRAIAINFEAQAPPEDVKPYTRPRDTRTGRSIRIPGTFAGLHLAQQKYGRLRWHEVLEPAIFYAENGFPIHALAYVTMRENYNTLTLHPSGRRIFAPDGFLPRVGSLFKQSELAETLKRIAADGPDYFYKGPFAEQMVRAIREIGGRSTIDDFARYRPVEVEPVQGTYRNYSIIGPPPPNVGPLGVIEGLQILEHVDLKALGHYTQSAEALQWLIETLRAVDARKFSRLPEVDGPLTKLLLSSEHARAQYEMIRHRIEQMKATPAPQSGYTATAWDEFDRSQNTNNVSVIDSEGSLCSITNTVYGAVYGTSGLFVGGLVLNSGGGHPALPGQFLSSPKAPMIVLKDGKPFLAAGSSGGVPNPFFLLVNVLVWDKNFKEAQEAPRFRISSSFYTDWRMNQAGPENDVQIEHRVEQKVIEELRRRGYQVDWAAPYSMANAQLVGLDPASGTRYGAADPRSVGHAAGQ